MNPEGVTVHEFGHQFWYGMVGNNEFEEAWLDEGFNTYSTGKVLETAYPRHAVMNICLRHAGSSFTRGSESSCRSSPSQGSGKSPWAVTSHAMQSRNARAAACEYLENAKDDDLVRNGWQYLDGRSYVVNSIRPAGSRAPNPGKLFGLRKPWRASCAPISNAGAIVIPTTRDFIDVVNEVSGQNMNWFFEQFFYSSNVADYEVSDLRSEPVEGKVGVYDENGKKVTYLEQDAARAAEKSKNKVYRSTVVVRRLGEALRLWMW